jgi:hypothetical protein
MICRVAKRSVPTIHDEPAARRWARCALPTLPRCGSIEPGVTATTRTWTHWRPTKGAIEHMAVIYTGSATRLVRKHRFDDGPFVVAEFVAYDSKAPVRSMNHVHGRSINPQTASRSRQFSEFTSAFGGIADKAGLEAGSTRSRMTQLGHQYLSILIAGW